MSGATLQCPVGCALYHPCIGGSTAQQQTAHIHLTCSQRLCRQLRGSVVAGVGAVRPSVGESCARRVRALTVRTARPTLVWVPCTALYCLVGFFHASRYDEVPPQLQVDSTCFEPAAARQVRVRVGRPAHWSKAWATLAKARLLSPASTAVVGAQWLL